MAPHSSTKSVNGRKRSLDVHGQVYGRKRPVFPGLTSTAHTRPLAGVPSDRFITLAGPSPAASASTDTGVGSTEMLIKRTGVTRSSRTFPALAQSTAQVNVPVLFGRNEESTEESEVMADAKKSRGTAKEREQNMDAARREVRMQAVFSGDVHGFVTGGSQREQLHHNYIDGAEGNGMNISSAEVETTHVDGGDDDCADDDGGDDEGADDDGADDDVADDDGANLGGVRGDGTDTDGLDDNDVDTDGADVNHTNVDTTDVDVADVWVDGSGPGSIHPPLPTQSLRDGSKMCESSHVYCEPALEYYTVRWQSRNRSKQTVRHRNRIERRRKISSSQVPSWNKLESIDAVEYAGDKYKPGDEVYIFVGEGLLEPAKIYEIRDLGDGRKVVAVLWHFSKHEVEARGIDMARWPAGATHILTNWLQVLMWDTLNGLPDRSEIRTSKEVVLDICHTPGSICSNDDLLVRWTQEI